MYKRQIYFPATNTFLPSQTLPYTNDNKHQLIPRMTYHAVLQKPLLAFFSYDNLSESIVTMFFDIPSNSFINYNTMIPPAGWHFFYSKTALEISNDDTIAIVYPQNMYNTQRLIIYQC